ncbi:MAG: S-layer homology domain-containing protein, partial [Anaerovoracaceae bacterium]
ARSGNGSYNSSGIGYGNANAVNLVRTDPASITITGTAIVTASSANGVRSYAAIGHNDKGNIAIGGTATIMAIKGTNTYDGDCGTISGYSLVISGSPSITVYSPNKQGDEFYLDNHGQDDVWVKPIYAHSVSSTVPVMAGIFPSAPHVKTIVLTGGDPESSKTIELPTNYASFATTVDSVGSYEGAMGIDVLQNSSTLSQTFSLVSGVNTFNVRQLDITPPDAPGGVTVPAGNLINAQAEAAGVEVVVSLGASGALANDSMELLLNYDSFSTPVTHVLTSVEIAAGSCTFTIPSGRLGIDGAKLLTPRIIDEAGNIGPTGTSRQIYLDTTAPPPPTDIRITPVGGTIASDTLNGTNTNMQARASIVSGEAVDGKAILYVNGIAQATDTAISAGDTEVVFDLGLDSAAALQSQVTAGGIVTVELSDFMGNTSDSVIDNPTLTVDYVVPSVDSVSVPPAASYKADRNIDFTIDFSENVFVTNGTPYIQVELETGGTVNASYTSGSGTSSLVFRYTVSPGDQDLNGIEITSDGISLNDGIIRDTAGNDANLELINVEDTAGILVDTTSPRVLGVSVPAAATYPSGQNLDFVVTFHENVVVNLENGTPSLSFDISSAGIVNASYISGSGTSVLTFRYTTQPGDWDGDGITIGEDIALNSSSIQDVAGNHALLHLNSIGDTSEICVDAVLPEILSATMDVENRYVDITFSKGIFGGGGSALTADKLALIFDRNGGEATAVAIRSLKKNDNDVEGMAFSLRGGETIVRAFIDITGTPSGLETIEMGPFDGVSIFDERGNAMVANETTGAIALQDQIPPTLVTSGAVMASDATSNSVRLTWSTATDQKTTEANLEYGMVYSQEDNISTVGDAVSNGAIAGDWTRNITTGAVTGLRASTKYYFNVLVRDEAGNVMAYTSTAATTTRAPGRGDSSIIGTGQIFINGVEETVGNTMNWTNSEGRSVTSITLDSENVDRILDSAGANPVLILSMNTQADVVSGVFTGDVANVMNEKGATLVIETQRASYSLPVSEINTSGILNQFGENVELEDIQFTISISEPSEDTFEIISNAAENGGFAIVVPPVNFTIRCEYNGKGFDIRNFSAYVERTIAIPEGVDPFTITTAIVTYPDGTLRHVPTMIEEKNGKYYARINSLTNSTYTVIHHSVQFPDVENHWAKDAINNMGSRMIVKGVRDGVYQPNRSITRGEFATIVVNALGVAPGSKEIGFKDVRDVDWFHRYVSAAVEYGLITGYTAERFGPLDTITRQQAMAIIARAMNLTGMAASLTDNEIKGLISEFKDGHRVSNYAKESVSVCLKSGVITGTSENILSPNAPVTRGEVAMMVQRLMKKSGLI